MNAPLAAFPREFVEKVGTRGKKKNRNEGGGGREWSNFHPIARLETLATQATPSLD